MPDEKPDSAELDAIIELQKHPGWALVAARIAEEIERQRSALECEMVEQQAAVIRGRLNGYRTMLQIPAILREEIQRSL